MNQIMPLKYFNKKNDMKIFEMTQFNEHTQIFQNKLLPL